MFPMGKKVAGNMGMMMGESMEKSSGDPLLDKVSVTMAEHRHAVGIQEKLEKLRQLLAGPGVSVRLHLGVQITGAEMTPLEMRE